MFVADTHRSDGKRFVVRLAPIPFARCARSDARSSRHGIVRYATKPQRREILVAGQCLFATPTLEGSAICHLHQKKSATQKQRAKQG